MYCKPQSNEGGLPAEKQIVLNVSCVPNRSTATSGNQSTTAILRTVSRSCRIPGGPRGGGDQGNTRQWAQAPIQGNHFCKRVCEAQGGLRFRRSRPPSRSTKPTSSKHRSFKTFRPPREFKSSAHMCTSTRRNAVCKGPRPKHSPGRHTFPVKSVSQANDKPGQLQ